jgi:hypothetical protein
VLTALAAPYLPTAVVSVEWDWSCMLWFRWMPDDQISVFTVGPFNLVIERPPYWI